MMHDGMPYDPIQGQDQGHRALDVPKIVLFQVCLLRLPSNRHHRSNGDCLEGKRENYQVCSVQYCAQQLCTVQCTDI